MLTTSQSQAKTGQSQTLVASAQRRLFVPVNAARQGGVALVISLIMLTMMSMLAISSVSDTVSYTQITNNAQFRKSAEAAAQVAIEKVIASQVTTLTNTEYPFSSFDHKITIGNLTWDVQVEASYLGRSLGETATETSLLLMGHKTGPDQNHWELIARVADDVTNTTVEVHQGFVTLAH